MLEKCDLLETGLRSRLIYIILFWKGLGTGGFAQEVCIGGFAQDAFSALDYYYLKLV